MSTDRRQDERNERRPAPAGEVEEPRERRPDEPVKAPEDTNATPPHGDALGGDDDRPGLRVEI